MADEKQIWQRLRDWERSPILKYIDNLRINCEILKLEKGLWFIREDATWALWKLDDKGHDVSDALPTLINALNDEKWNVRYGAANALIEIREKSIKEGNYLTALTLIKEFTLRTIKRYEGKKDRDSLKERREELGKLASLAQKIYEMLSPLDKREPIAWKRPQKGAKSVFKPFSSKTVYTR